jgi:ribonuclease HII
VVLPADFPREILGDSKKLSPRKREAARVLVCAKALVWGIGWASAGEIDELNILKASLLAMRRAYEAMNAPESLGVLMAVADGLYAPDIPIPCRAIVKADAQVPEVMAASILAKTARDQKMEEYARLYPQYGYERHKGYATKFHREAVAKYGPSPIQRKSFRVKI